MVQCNGRVVGGAVFLACAAAFAAGEMPATTPAVPPSSEIRAEAEPRVLVERAVGRFLDVLRDKAVSADERGNRIDAILQDHMDFATLSRLMLGSTWTNATQAQKDAFIEQLSKHLMGVYLPLTEAYTDQKVAVTGDKPEQRGDHTVLVGISNQKGGSERQIATIVCRLRRVDADWKVIDLRIEGISVATIFGAQFRPVVAREGFDGLIEQLRARNAQRKTAGPSVAASAAS